MIHFTLSVDKQAVLDEVAQTTSYAGAKLTEEQENRAAYDRIMTTDEDASMLERFWAEACSGATDEFKQFILADNSDAAAYTVRLELSSAFEGTLVPSMQKSLFSYFVNSIVSKWFKFTNRSETEDYGNYALAAMADIHTKIFYRKRPTRKPV